MQCKIQTWNSELTLIFSILFPLNSKSSEFYRRTVKTASLPTTVDLEGTIYWVDPPSLQPVGNSLNEIETVPLPGTSNPQLDSTECVIHVVASLILLLTWGHSLNSRKV
jgi:hypothetical protein